jgi:phage terminase large subunit-like protein
LTDFSALTDDERKRIADSRDWGRRKCLTDLYFLVTEVLYHQDAHKYGPFHKWMADTVGKVPSTRELWLLPRDHFKTTILTIGHAIQRILNRPDVSILIVSRKDEMAHLMSDEIRRQFVSNERLKILFPDWCPETLEDKGAKGQWMCPAYRIIGGKRRKEPTVIATGIKSTQQSLHYDWMYPDDCMDSADTTEVGLREIREDFRELIPLASKDTGIIICGTRKHYNDIYQAQMDTETYKVYVRHGLESATICKDDECRWSQPHGAVDFKSGKPICPERMERKDYEQKLKECEIDPKLGVSFFHHEYMNIPFSPTDRKFQPGWFTRVDDGMIPGSNPPFHPLRKAIAVETAWKEEEHPSGHDFTVIVVGGFDDFGRLYILDILRSKTWTVKAGCEAIVTCMKTQEYGGISHIITEKVSDNISWHDFLRDRCHVAGIPLVLQHLSRGGGGQGRKSKFERIEAISGYFEQGKVFFRKKAENFEDCVNEFTNLRRWTNDDIADAISMFFDERVIQRPQSNLPAGPSLTTFRPMPFDGAERMAAYATAVKPASKPDPRKKEEVPIAQAWSGTFVPRDRTNDVEPRPAFRPYR